MGKYILQWFGGGPGVWTALWTACLLFFQCDLLVGYSYAHLISTRLGSRRQTTLHLSALAFSLLLLLITLDPSWTRRERSNLSSVFYPCWWST